MKAKSVAAPGCNWLEITDQSGGPFTHELHPGGDVRGITINGPFVPGYDYLIEPKTDTQGSNYLYCGELDTTVGVYDYDYRLRVLVLQDLNVSGELETGDIAAWIAEPADTTLDGVADVADLVDVTEAVADWGE